MSYTKIWHPMTAGASFMGATLGPMQTGYQLAVPLLQDVMAQDAPTQLARWKQLTHSDPSKPQVMVVDGNYDQMHYLLEASRIPYARLHLSDRHLLGAALTELPSIRALLINCASNFPEEAADRAAEFVKAGGLLVTSDWAITYVLERAFPGIIRHTGNRNPDDEFVNVAPYSPSDPNSRFLQKISDAAGQELIWWLEPGSLPFERLSDGVQILLYSTQLKERYGNGSVMVTFQYGAGRVVHMISHAHLQKRKSKVWKIVNGADEVTRFTASMGGSPDTIATFTNAAMGNPQFDVSAAASAAASTAVFLSTLLNGMGNGKAR
jgi:hypothetical protein